MARSGAERQVTVLAIGLAACFVALAFASLMLPSDTRPGAWLPVHLLFAGGAATAIAGVMPFFSAAVSGAPPAPASVRAGAVTAVAAGALLVSAGRVLNPALTGPDAQLTAFGALVYITGLVLVGWATLVPLRRALGPRRVVIAAIYGSALVNVILGAGLAALLLLGFAPVVADWPALKPAHAWLNLFGFVSLTIAGSLLHLLPTVVGARIGRTRASLVSVAGLAAGPLLAATGFAMGSTPVALAGAALVVVAALALGLHALNTMRARATWTTDPDWHRFTTWSLVAGVAWFIVGGLAAAATIWNGGATSAGWQLSPLIAPLGIGWVAQVLVACPSRPRARSIRSGGHVDGAWPVTDTVREGE